MAQSRVEGAYFAFLAPSASLGLRLHQTHEYPGNTRDTLFGLKGSIREPKP